MRAFQITDTKTFTSRLFLMDTFDAFYLVEGEIRTHATMILDGHLQKDFYSEEELEELELKDQPFIYWRLAKPLCLSAIKGTHTPLSFRFSFRLSEKNTAKLLERNLPSLKCEDIAGLFVNIRFADNKVTLTTGSAMNFFTLDKSLDQVWDQMVEKFLKQAGIEFEIS